MQENSWGYLQARNKDAVENTTRRMTHCDTVLCGLCRVYCMGIADSEKALFFM